MREYSREGLAVMWVKGCVRYSTSIRGQRRAMAPFCNRLHGGLCGSSVVEPHLTHVEGKNFFQFGRLAVHTKIVTDLAPMQYKRLAMQAYPSRSTQWYLFQGHGLGTWRIR